jgi:hypothetical protein
MGKRTRNEANRKLALQKETLRKLQEQRALSDEELRAAAGGMGSAKCAPSHCGC